MDQLVRPALRYLRHHPRLLLPALAHFVLDAVFVVGVAFVFAAQPAAGVALLIAAVYAMALVAVFADAVVVAAVSDAAAGRPLSLRHACRTALGCWTQLVVWAGLLITVVFAIRFIAGLFGRIGQVLGLTFAAAWTIAALLVVPSIVVDGLPAPVALDESFARLRQTFGDRVRAYVGLSLGAVAVLVGAALLLVLAALSDSGILIVACCLAIVIAVALYAFVFDGALAIVGYVLLAHSDHRPLPPGFGPGDVTRAVDAHAVAR